MGGVTHHIAGPTLHAGGVRRGEVTPDKASHVSRSPMRPALGASSGQCSSHQLGDDTEEQ
jgi:hypothetical protein